MGIINSNFRFHPIGQGCFYSGKLQLRNVEFNFVYDCGTDSKMKILSNEITSYKNNLSSDQLDLLLISHFDADHVNGVAELLKGIKCKRVIIPYYNPIERLLLVALTGDISADYLFFLRNPINYFIEYGVEEVILVGGPDDNEKPQENINPENIPLDNIDLEKLEEIIAKISTLDKDQVEKVFARIEECDEAIKQPKKVKVLKKPYKLSLYFWEFVFYLKKHDDEILMSKVTKDIDSLLKKEGVSITNLFEEEYIGELKKIYNLYFNNDFNNTSLVTYHGATINPRKSYYIKENSKHLICFFDCKKKQFGTLLTGDIDLKSNRNTQKMINFYIDYINKVCFFQVPHHGAKANWNFNIPNGLESFCYYIINHGLGRKHHPSLDVIEYINENCTERIVQLNNEAQNFEYGFWFEF